MSQVAKLKKTKLFQKSDRNNDTESGEFNDSVAKESQKRKDDA
jgi:hypothetical protein